jgi:hypothetical protein
MCSYLRVEEIIGAQAVENALEVDLVGSQEEELPPKALRFLGNFVILLSTDQYNCSAILECGDEP